MLYDSWRKLDLESPLCRPETEQLVVLRIYNTRTKSVHYEIGCFKIPEGRRKLWWYRDQRYPVDQKSLYGLDSHSFGKCEIKWFPLPPETLNETR